MGNDGKIALQIPVELNETRETGTFCAGEFLLNSGGFFMGKYKYFLWSVVITATAVIMFMMNVMYVQAGQDVRNPYSKSWVREVNAEQPADEVESESAEQSVRLERIPAYMQELYAYCQKRPDFVTGVLMVAGGTTGSLHMLRRYSVRLYGYDGGNAYHRLGVFQLTRGEEELLLQVPEHRLQAGKVVRYRLLLHEGLARESEAMDIVIKGGKYNLRQPVEECIDFVL